MLAGVGNRFGEGLYSNFFFLSTFSVLRGWVGSRLTVYVCLLSSVVIVVVVADAVVIVVVADTVVVVGIVAGAVVVIIFVVIVDGAVHVIVTAAVVVAFVYELYFILTLSFVLLI